jgi:GT2 family glycosyltransferase
MIPVIEKTKQPPEDFIVMGVCSYDTRAVRWLDTLRAHYDGRAILVLTSDYPAGLADAYDVDIRRVIVPDGFWHNRIGLGCYQWQYIQPVAVEFPETYILRTDVFDVVFQDDPRNYVAGDREWIYIEQEGMLNRDNDYMCGWFSINPDVNPVIYQQPVYNAGAICARGKHLADIAAFISQRRGRTYADQTELAIYMHDHGEAFTSVPLFFGHFGDMLGKMQIADGRYFVNKKNREKYCVCHANGKTTHYLDSVYPYVFYAQRLETSSSRRQNQSAVELTIGIPVKDRPVELALLLQSLLNQTFQHFSVLLVNDCQETDFLSKNSTIEGLLNLLDRGGSTVTIVVGDHKGPQYCGQRILENAGTDLIFRLDDDVVLLPDCLEKLMAVLAAGHDAVGPIYLDPWREMRDQAIPAGTSREDLIKAGRIYWQEDLFLSGLLQVNLHPTQEPVPVEHLNSGFLYRKAAALKAGGYFLGYSVVGHREETDISYRMFRSGAKLAVAPAARAYHFHPAYGGIRETKGQLMCQSLWDGDEKIFRERLRGWMTVKNCPVPGCSSTDK